MPEQSRSNNKPAPQGQLAETVQLLKDYARQETVGPLKGAARWIIWGVAGALAIGIGTAFLVLGLIRLVQTEWPGTFDGRWAHLFPYLFGLLFCALVIVLAMLRINKQPLNKEKR